MNRLAAAISAASLAAAAHAQSTLDSTVTFALSYAEGPGGNGNGIIEPGESAVLRITVSFTNQNSTASFSPPIGNWNSGTIRGFGLGFIDLHGAANNGGGAQGSWNLDQTGTPAYGTNVSWEVVGDPSGSGTPINSGADLVNIQLDRKSVV